MDQTVKAKWVAALRSGDYSQTTGLLHDSTGFCCLGVLCDLKDQDAWKDVSDEDIDANTYLGETELPPSSVFMWAGLPVSRPEKRGLKSDDVPEVSIDGVTAAVSEHNDNGHTFAEIADAIEAQL